ncbi:MAG: hypothetical protein AAF391_05775 [Bacteroidota bacterium]
MKFLKHYSMLAVIATAVLMSACTTDENPCPGINVNVDIDSANLIADIKATGLEDLAFEVFVNDALLESFEAGQLDSVDFEVQFEPGEYKVCIVAESQSCDQRIEGCVEFVIEESSEQRCLDLEFEPEQLDDYTYKFYAEFEGMDTVEYDWYVNGELVRSELLNNERTNKLLWDFEIGTHSVCIVYENDTCGELEFCQEITIEKVCPEEVYFDWRIENKFSYLFYADFEKKHHVKYQWLINGEVVDEENVEGQDTDHKFFWQFEAGEYTICLVTNDDDCETVEYCETIIVEESQECLDLSYTADLDENTNTYTFTADFEGKDDVTYIWKVFINEDFQGEEVREAGSDDDHQFEWQMEPGVEYEICLKQDGNCLDKQVCETFSVTQ